MDRRNFLRGLFGTSVALPLLESVGATSGVAWPMPKRMVCIGYQFGLAPKLLFPTKFGKDYEMSTLLKPMVQHRDDFTLFSGLDHGLVGGHHTVHTFLSGIKAQDASNMLEGNISVDQKAAMSVGAKTRYSSLQFSPDSSGQSLLSWSASGTAIPPIQSLQTAFNLLFKSTAKLQLKKEEAAIISNTSILDLVKDDADFLMKRVSKSDQEKLDQYFASVREVEKKLTMSKEWLHRAKPQVNYTLPSDADSLDFAERVPLFYDLMTLALQTDSTRVISLSNCGLGKNSGGLPITKGYHTLTHHGKVEATLEELAVIEVFHMSQVARFLDKLKEVKEPDGRSLFDNTMTLVGSGLGNASSHSNKDLPVLLAGGDFKHNGHMKVEKKANMQSVPLNNLYLSMLQQFGLETDTFNTSSGTLTGFEARS